MRATIFQVSALSGALVECVATCMCRVVSRVLGDLNPRFSTVIDAFVGTSLVVAGRRTFLYFFSRREEMSALLIFDINISAFNYTGGYFNPALATSLKYGCLGTSSLEHVMVYWIGACIGSIASLRVYRMPFVQNLIQLQESTDAVYS